MNIIQLIVKADYAATEAQIETLAGMMGQGHQADGTYLKVLAAACQAELAHKRKVSTPIQRSVIDRAHERFYPFVQRGVGADEIGPKERTRRSTFARTAASTLRSFVEGGGDIRTLVLADISKAKLRRHGRPVPTGTRAERSFQVATDAVMRTALKLAAKDGDGVRERLEATIETLQAVVEGLKPAPRRAAVGRRAKASEASATH